MLSNPAYDLLVVVKTMLNNEIDPLLETYSQNYQSSPELLQVLSLLSEIRDLILNQRPAYYGLFTCDLNQTVTANNQLIPFAVSFGGTLFPNADGTFTLPANTKWLVDIDINGVFSASNIITFALYDADSGSQIQTFQCYSESYSSTSDLQEIKVSEISIGSSSRRFGIKVVTKQTTGTFTMSQYSSYIKIHEV